LAAKRLLGRAPSSVSELEPLIYEDAISALFMVGDFHLKHALRRNAAGRQQFLRYQLRGISNMQRAYDRCKRNGWRFLEKGTFSDRVFDSIQNNLRQWWFV
jgi:hypothetical protein